MNGQFKFFEPERQRLAGDFVFLHGGHDSFFKESMQRESDKLIVLCNYINYTVIAEVGSNVLAQLVALK